MQIRRYPKIVLNVAEKPSVAREIVHFLSNGESRKLDSLSQYNPVSEFRYKIKGEEVLMRVTSVQGHIMSMEFNEPYNKWNEVSPEELFEAPITKSITFDKYDISNNLKNAARNIDMLALWLDCDREGENIAYEVIHIVSQVINLPSYSIRRAHFSALTKRDIEHAIQNLDYPRLELSEAVDARQEIDLRLGAIFTRYQTIRLRSSCPSVSGLLLSWGPCQFPTLGFVVQRQLDINNFVPEKYWTIDMKVARNTGKTVSFIWGRKRLFDFLAVLVLYEICLEAKTAKVINVTRKEKSKWRPVPLSTIAFQKLASKKLRIDSDKAMSIAEKLYQKGIISYPRTETDSFKSTINLKQLVELHTDHKDWGKHAKKITQNFQWPRSGSHDDNSHPPIHPVKSISKDQLQSDEWKVYELISRHFLACTSLDAKGYETVVQVHMGGETFEVKGLQIAELNFLKVYPYIKWNEADLPVFVENEEFAPTSLMMNEHDTQPPSLLSESDLITLMDKSGIGTDATIHQHIKTIQDRKYAEKNSSSLFKPTQLGFALVVGYASIGCSIHKPELRAKMEKEMNEIVNKTKTKREVISNTLKDMEEVFRFVKQKFQIIANNVKDNVETNDSNVATCFKCGNTGHFANQCESKEAIEDTPGQTTGASVKKCFKCGNTGHFANQCEFKEIIETTSGQPTAQKCFKCGESGHYANNCQYKNNQDAQKCFNCGKAGHYSNACKGKKQKIPSKKCEACGTQGKHTKNSSCPKKTKKKK